MTDREEQPLAAETATEALLKLGATHPQLSEALARLIEAIAEEARRTPRFAKTLAAALENSPGASAVKPKHTGRRTPGVFDPFTVYVEAGEEGLRNRLSELDLERLRDIVAEHGMDHDRLAMKWKDPQRVIGRIIDKVTARSAKGSAFRSASG